MRKVIHLLLTGLTIVVLTACGGSNGDTTPSGITEVLEDIAGNANGTPATAEQINSIPGVDGAVEGVDYSVALAAGAYADPENPTADEIQAVIDDVNSSNQDVGAVTDSNAATNTAAENAAVGAVVGITAQATDPDSSDTVTYTLTDDAGGLFAINGTSGVVTVAAALDYETATTHSITVLATSSDSSTSTKVMTITVTNVADVTATLANSTGSVAENAAAGDAVGTVTISDNGDAAITAITLSGTGEGNFTVATDGNITVAAGATLDFETTASYSLTAVATNTAGDSASVTVDITVTDTADIVATLANSTGTVAEDAGTGAAVGTISITEGDAAITTITLSGTGNENFEVSTTGAITVAAGASLDFEAIPSYNLTAVATNGAGNSAPADVTITVTNINEVPTITTSAAQSVAENQTAVVALAGTDPESDTLSWSITGGADQGAFSLSGADISFASAPDFETPTDADTNNVYNVEVTADDGNGGTVAKMIAVTVTDVNEEPTITTSEAQSIVENQTAVVALAGTDPESDTLSWSITGAADQGAFSLLGVDLSFASAPDFENPTDNGGNNIYEVEVTADDGNGGTVAKTINVEVTNEIEEAIFTISGITDADVVANETYNVTAGTSGEDPIGDVTYSLGGADALDFNINDATVSMTAPGFDTTIDTDGDYVYEVSITATDADGNTASEDWTVTVTHTDGYRVISYGSQRWLDRNLGATAVCTQHDPYENADPTIKEPCMGDYYQWGRLQDDHEILAYQATTTTPSPTIDPGHGDFITTDPLANWLTSNNVTLWQDPGSANNGVCPNGWRVPTQSEFVTLAITDSEDAFSKIRLHNSGYRNGLNGDRENHVAHRTSGFYWTSTVDSVDEDSIGYRILNAGTGGVAGDAYFNDWPRSDGFQVRCIKD